MGDTQTIAIQPLENAVDKTAFMQRLRLRRPRPYLVIAMIASILSLVTAQECHSITYLPSLSYGFVLWGWWGALGCGLWKFGQTNASGIAFSPRQWTMHLILAPLVSIIHLLLL